MPSSNVLKQHLLMFTVKIAKFSAVKEENFLKEEKMCSLKRLSSVRCTDRLCISIITIIKKLEGR